MPPNYSATEGEKLDDTNELLLNGDLEDGWMLMREEAKPNGV